MERRDVVRGLVTTALGVPVIGGIVDGQAPSAELANWADWWVRSKAFTLAIAAAMPPADYKFVPFGSGASEAVKSGDGARTFGALMQHIGSAEGFYLGRFGKGAAPAPPQNDDSKDATVTYLNAVLDWSITTVKQLTSADMAKTYPDPRGQNRPPMTGLDLLLNAMVHTAHTRGYSEMYLRNKGVKPPTYSV